MMANAALLCLHFVIIRFVLLSAVSLLSGVVLFLLFSSVCFCTLTIFDDVNTFVGNEELNYETLKWCFTERNPIGPLDSLWNQNLPIHSVHPSFLNLGLRSPIWPVHEPETNKSCRIRISKSRPVVLKLCQSKIPHYRSHHLKVLWLFQIFRIFNSILKKYCHKTEF